MARRLSRALLFLVVSVVVLAAGSQAASAATMSLTADANPTAGANFGITASGTADGGSIQIYAERNESGTATCATTLNQQQAHPAQQLIAGGSVSPGPYDNRYVASLADAGTYLICGWNYDFAKGPDDPFSATASITIQVGAALPPPTPPPASTMALAADLNPKPNVDFGITASGQFEPPSAPYGPGGTVVLTFERNEGGTATCPTTNQQTASSFGNRNVSPGSYSERFLGRIQVPGTYLVCGGLLDEGRGSGTFSATASISIQVTAPPAPPPSPSTLSLKLDPGSTAPAEAQSGRKTIVLGKTSAPRSP